MRLVLQRSFSVLFSLMLILAGLQFVTYQPAGADVESDMALGIDLSGNDINSFDLNMPDPGLCREACERESRCQAWTFVRPGVQGPAARCWLKDQMPVSTWNEAAVSGARGSAAPLPPGGASIDSDMRPGINLAGNDITSIALPRSDPLLCLRACDADPNCQSWSFVKPGVQSQGALCWIKNGSPQASFDANVVSGSRRNPPPVTTGGLGGSGLATAGATPSSLWGVWASAAMGNLGDPCQIVYNAAQVAGNRYDGNPLYVRVRTRASQPEADLDIDHFGRFHRDQPDGIVKLVPCDPSTVIASGGGAPPLPNTGTSGTGGGADWGVWASASGGNWTDPCAIQYNAAQIAGNRYDGDPGYVRVRTRATQQEADLDIDHFGKYNRDQPDGFAKLVPCNPETVIVDDGSGGGNAAGGTGGTGGNVAPVAGTYGPPAARFGQASAPYADNEKKFTGSVTPNSATMTIEYVPASAGTITMQASYSGSLPQILKPGDVIDLSCEISASAAGEFVPNQGRNCWWEVQHDGNVEFLEGTSQHSAFAGKGVDGKFYPSGKYRTVFKVGREGKIKIIAQWTGFIWGDSPNWNPAEYEYSWTPD